jgi:peptidoglycan biosynthesis protein MviN/MurJ (putative lipid II flippase)
MINVRKTSFYLTGFRLVRAFLGIASVLLTARFFGTSKERDFFVLAMTATTVLPAFTFGAFSEIFRAKFVHIRETLSLEKAVASARTLIWGIFFISIAIVALGIYRAELLASVFSENISENSLRELAFMIRLTLPIMIFSQLSAYWSRALNCFESFYVPEVAGMVSSIIEVILIVCFAPSIGIYSLLISSYFSNILLISAVLFLLHKKCPDFLSFKIESFLAIKPYIFAALPFWVGNFLGQITSIVEKRFSSGFGIGNVAILNYAQKLLSVPQSVVFSVVASVLTPVLAKYFANNCKNEFANESLSFYRFILILFAPFAFLMFFCSSEIGNLLFANSDSASSQEIRRFAVAVSIYAFGLFGVIHYIIFMQVLVAKGENVKVSIVGALNQITIVGCNILFAYRFGIWGLAASWSVCSFVSGLIFMFMSKINLRGIIVSIAKIIMLYLFSFGLFFLIKNIFYHFGDLFKIILSLFIFVIFLFIGLFVFRFEERKKIWAKLF